MEEGQAGKGVWIKGSVQEMESSRHLREIQEETGSRQLAVCVCSSRRMEARETCAEGWGKKSGIVGM